MGVVLVLGVTDSTTTNNTVPRATKGTKAVTGSVERLSPRTPRVPSSVPVESRIDTRPRKPLPKARWRLTLTGPLAGTSIVKRSVSPSTSITPLDAPEPLKLSMLMREAKENWLVS